MNTQERLEIAVCDIWLQECHVANRASRLVRAYEALSAIDAQAGSAFLDDYIDQINSELSATDLLATYVVDDFFPDLIRDPHAQTYSERLAEIECAVCEKWVERQIDMQIDSVADERRERA